MKKPYFFWYFFLILFACGAFSPAMGQGPSFSVQPEEPAGDWECKPSKTSNFKVGDKFSISFTMKLTDHSWHLYSVQPAPKEMGYNPTMFELYDDEAKDIELVGGLSESVKPFSYYDDLMEDSVRYFKEHEVTFKQNFKVTGPNPNISGGLVYQICKDPEGGGMCRFPTAALTWAFKADAGNTETVDNNPPENGNDTPEDDGQEDPENGTEPEDTSGQKIDSMGSTDPATTQTDHGSNEGANTAAGGSNKDNETSLWFLFFEAFLFGFAAVLTPCVFPMIPLTVTFFTKQSGSRAKGISNALLYGFFIIFIYTALGIGVSMAFGKTFLYEMSINPWVNLAFFILLFVFALSFLGMFEITLPNSFVNKIDSQSDRGGFIGIFFMALTLAVVSFSCTGPLVGTALIDAVSGSIWGPIMSMFGFSLALAIPIMLFAIFPGWMSSMPKSGGWLNSVKVVLGFAELALGLKFLSQADLYMKWHILDREIFIAAWIVIFGLLGLYLLGKLRLPHDSPTDSISVPRLMLAMSSLIFTFYLVPGLWGANLAWVSGLLPPHNPDVGVRIIGAKNVNEGTFNGKVCKLDNRKYLETFAEKEGHGFCAFYDLDEAIEFGKKENMPLFLDFTGHTCANCRLMENNVWIQPQIESILKKEFVMVSLYADEKMKLPQPEEINGVKCRKMGEKYLQIQIRDYGTFAQPYYVVMDPYEAANGPQKSNLAIPRGYTPDENEYKAFLLNGVKEFRKRHGE